jgi:predicted nucleic acid-binding protein
VLLDATALLLLLNEKTLGPLHPETKLPIADAHERIEDAVNKIRERGEQIIIASPVLAELLVRAENAASPYLELFNKSAHFRPVPFDQKAAITHAEYTRKAIDAGEEKTESKCKVKFDRQIVAIAKAEGADTIYTDDDGLARHATTQGIKVIRTHEIVMNKQPDLFTGILEVIANGKADETAISEANTKGETVVETVPPPRSAMLEPNKTQN